MVSDIAKEMSAIATALEALSTLDDKQREFALATINQRFAFVPSSSPLSPTLQKPQTLNNGSIIANGTEDISGMTPKQFMAAKRPKSDIHRMACLGFYLANARETPHFKAADLSKLNTEAAQSPITNPSRAVDNATKEQLLAPAGGGKKQITQFGEDIVNALPNEEAVTAAMASKQKRRPKPTKKVSKK